MFGTMMSIAAMLAPSPADPAEALNATAWVTPDDYPPVAIERQDSGTVGVSLNVAATGRIDGCTVTASSGSPLLDVTTCTLIRQRARYEPATDRTGRAIASTQTQRITWQIPKDDQPKIDWEPREMSTGVAVTVDIDDHGAVSQCRSNRSGDAVTDPFSTMMEEMGKTLCAQTSQAETMKPLRDASGKAVPARLTFTVKADITRR